MINEFVVDYSINQFKKHEKKAYKWSKTYSFFLISLKYSVKKIKNILQNVAVGKVVIFYQNFNVYPYYENKYKSYRLMNK